MKIQITAEKVVVAFGEFVSVAPESTDSIVTEEATVATLNEVAVATGIEITAKRKADIITQLVEGLRTLNIPEVAEMTDTQKYLEVIQTGLDAEQSDDQIKEGLYNAGCGFGDINKVFSNILKEYKLRLTPKEIYVKASEFLTGYAPEPEDVNGHLAKIAQLQDHLKVASTKAGSLMKKWAKEFEVTLPKAPPAERKAREAGFAGNHKIIADWALENQDCTREQLFDFAKANVPLSKTGKENWRGYANDIFNAMDFAKKMYAPAVEEEATEEAA